MSHQATQRASTLCPSKVHFAFASALLMLACSNAGAESNCRPVNGHFTEQAFIQGCASPVGLCLTGTSSGVVKGNFETTVKTLTASADTQVTGAYSFTSDTVIHAQMGKLAGDVSIRNAGIYRTIGNGEIIDLQIIIGGTGGFAGMTGVIKSAGTFTNGVGSSEYTGSVCLP
jgi:hypothetical protein